MSFLRVISNAAFILSLSLHAQTLARPANFTSSSKLVLVPVTVTDHSGKTVLGLQAKDFNLFDDHAPQSIVSLSSEDLPSSIGLVLDSSGSMQRVLGVVKEGARSLVQQANPQDEFLMLTVSTEPEVAPAFTTDLGDVDRMIAEAHPGGMTALIDTVYQGLRQMHKAHLGQRALVVFSDGMDNHSRYSESQLLNLALEADVQIYTVILDGLSSTPRSVPYRPSMIAKPGDRGAEQQGLELLEKLADKTGGLHFRASRATEASEAMLKIGQAIRNHYVLGFSPSASGQSGKLHRIQVTANVPKVYVHARNGYYAP